MKRIAVLFLVAAFAVCWAGASYASEIKASGSFRVNAMMYNNKSMINTDDGVYRDDFNIYERARIAFKFIAHENLEGIFYIQYGNVAWGSGPFELDEGAGNTGNIGVKRAYINFKWPDTDILVTAGYWNVALPSAFQGGMILNTEVASAAVNAPILDWLGVLVGYARAIDMEREGTTRTHDEFDLGYFAVPITPEGFNITPFFVYGYRGRDAVPASGFITDGLISPAGGIGNQAWWAGAAFTMDMFDPINVMADFNWGQMSAAKDADGRNGWYADLAVEYTGLDFMTPQLFFAYSSGDNDDADDGSERMPSLYNDFGPGSLFFGGSDLAGGDFDEGAQVGFWTVGITLDDISFIEKLSHTVSVLYIGGTNDHELLKNMGTLPAGYIRALTLTDKDDAIEVDFNTKYKIYEELTAVLELSYLDISLDKDTWEAAGQNPNNTSSLWKCGIGLIYKF